MKAWLLLVAAFLLWPGCSSQNECEEPDEIDFGEFVSTKKAKYLENNRVQYRCNPSYVLEGPEWIQCKGQEWTPHPPKCLAPCSITRQQLAAKNLFLFGNQRKAQLIQSDQSLQFQCNEGYVLVVPSVRKCVDGYMDFPLCIPERGKNCGDPPRIENGDVIPLSEQQYRSGSSVEFRCQTNYAIEGQNRSFCDDGTWTKVPVCLQITCNAPSILHGSFRPQRTIYHDGDLIQIQCDSGFNGENVVECTKNGWSPSPKCVNVRCPSPPEIQNGQIIGEIKAKYLPREQVQYQCNPGYALLGFTFITCSKNGWTQTPSCTDIEAKCGRPPPVENGGIVDSPKLIYLHSENVTYQCQNFYTMEGSSRVTCQNGHWSQTPTCRDIRAKCGRPPPVENGDIVDSPKKIYLHSESVTYQCQRFYTMEGSSRVTCQNGHWSQTPTCRVPCIASEEDMREHNIRLKWNRGHKIYSEDGNIVEFVCLSGYKPHPNSGPLRVNCVDGKFNYPDCIPI